MDRSPASLSGGSPIQAVARRTGLSVDVIRVWERRYGVVSPSRTETGRRLYKESDVERLLLLQSAVAGGRRIGDIAGLTPAELEDLIRQDRRSLHPALSRRPGSAVPWAKCLESVRKLDAESLQGQFRREAARLGGEGLLEDVVAPLLREVGKLWAQGYLDPYHEHLATAVTRRTLHEMMSAVTPGNDAPGLVAATPAGQFHEVGALMAGTQAAIHGWRVLYLGVNLPAADIAAAARRFNAKAVALSLVFPPDDPSLGSELEALGEKLRNNTVLIVGGEAAVAYSAPLELAGAVLVRDTRSLKTALESLLEGAD